MTPRESMRSPNASAWDLHVSLLRRMWWLSCSPQTSRSACSATAAAPLSSGRLSASSPRSIPPMPISRWSDIGCERIFLINNVTREGVDELLEYLEEDEPHVTLEQAMFKQSLGLNEWDPLPEGVEYPEEIRDAR